MKGSRTQTCNEHPHFQHKKIKNPNSLYKKSCLRRGQIVWKEFVWMLGLLVEVAFVILIFITTVSKWKCSSFKFLYFYHVKINALISNGGEHWERKNQERQGDYWEMGKNVRGDRVCAHVWRYEFFYIRHVCIFITSIPACKV